MRNGQECVFTGLGVFLFLVFFLGVLMVFQGCRMCDTFLFMGGHVIFLFSLVFLSV